MLARLLCIRYARFAAGWALGLLIAACGADQPSPGNARTPFAPAKIASSKNDFVGVWRARDNTGARYYLKLNIDGEGRKTNNRLADCRWTFADNEARVIWSDGDTNIIVATPAGMVMYTLAPASNGIPDSTLLTKSSGIPPNYAGVWRAKEPGIAEYRVVLNPNGACTAYGKDTLTGAWDIVELDAHITWNDGRKSALTVGRSGYELRYFTPDGRTGDKPERIAFMQKAEDVSTEP